jgi:hypothetical protein
VLGRVAFAQALDRAAWRYWDGNTWNPALASAQSLFDGAPMLGVFFAHAVHRWIAIYARPLANQVVFRTAPQITGPWSDESDLFVPDRGSAGGNTYDALPHPELAERDGLVQYVTFSRPTGVFSAEFALVRVTFQ